MAAKIVSVTVDSKVCGDRCVVFVVCDNGAVWVREFQTCEIPDDEWAMCDTIPGCG